MPNVLGRDPAAIAAARFGARLPEVTFTRETFVSYDSDSPSAEPTKTSATFTGRGTAFSYDQRLVDGENVRKGDYMVTVLLGTIALVGNDAVKATLDLDPLLPNADTVLRARVAGTAGDAITAELVGDAPTAAGTRVEVGTNVRLGFLPGSTTVADLEALIAASALLEVGAAGTPGNVLAAGDALAATPLAGGTDATSSPSTATPAPGDAIRCPPPNATAPLVGRVIGVKSRTHAAITVQVRGAGAG